MGTEIDGGRDDDGFEVGVGIAFCGGDPSAGFLAEVTPKGEVGDLVGAVDAGIVDGGTCIGECDGIGAGDKLGRVYRPLNIFSVGSFKMGIPRIITRFCDIDLKLNRQPIVKRVAVDIAYLLSKIADVLEEDFL